MKIERLFFAVLTAGLMLFLPQSTARARENNPYRPGEIIVKLRRPSLFTYGSSQMHLNSISQRQNVRYRKFQNLSLERTFVLTVNAGSEEEIIGRLASDPDVKAVSRNIVLSLFETPNDPLYAQQYALPLIKASEAWDKSHGAAASSIAILDTGIDENHPEFDGRIVLKKNFLMGNVSDISDQNSHGTHVAGIAAALVNNAKGVAGIAWNTSLIIGRIGNINGEINLDAAIEAINWAADNGAKVINLSFGSCDPQGRLVFQEVINSAWNKGAVIVAAAGNAPEGSCTSTSQISYPAGNDHVVAVAATDENDRIAAFSLRGESWVPLAAPGVNILSTIPTTPAIPYGRKNGTSMSAPLVSGLISLLRGANTNLTNIETVSRLYSSAETIAGTGTAFKYGRINALKAINAALSDITPSPSPTSSPSPSPTSSPTPIPPTRTDNAVPGCAPPCPTPMPERAAGNANCDDQIDEADYLLWKQQYLVYLNGGTIAQPGDRTANFSCSPSDAGTQKITLIDYEYLRRSLYPAPTATPTPSPSPSPSLSPTP